MIPHLELYFGLIVARRLNLLDLKETVQYMVSRPRNFQLERKKDDYLIRWINAEDRDQNLLFG